ncbi:MAG: hypothetical protein JXX28_07490 [Deltaproteobacteria bacterium]|nr:hypothetical protein [Deltaproteobacteria bacterium]
MALPHLLSLGCLLLAGSARGEEALSWWVSSPAEAEEVEAALAALWPGHQVTVLVGAPPPDGAGVWRLGEELRLSMPPLRRSAPWPAEPSTEVALVRGWVLAAHNAPPPPPPPAPTEPRQAVVPFPTAPNTWLIGALGPASRRPERTPALSLSAELARRTAAGLVVDLCATWEPGEITSLEQLPGTGGARITRAGVGPGLGWALEAQGDSLWVLDLQADLRWIRARDLTDPLAAPALWTTWGAGLRAAHWWALQPELLFGGAVRVSADAPLPLSERQLPGGHSPRLRPLTLALEVRLARVLRAP